MFPEWENCQCAELFFRCLLLWVGSWVNLCGRQPEGDFPALSMNTLSLALSTPSNSSKWKMMVLYLTLSLMSIYILRHVMMSLANRATLLVPESSQRPLLSPPRRISLPSLSLLETWVDSSRSLWSPAGEQSADAGKRLTYRRSCADTASSRLV